MSASDSLMNPYLRSLIKELSNTLRILNDARDSMNERKDNAQEYYKPVKALKQKVGEAKSQVKQKSASTLSMIKKECEELEEILNVYKDLNKELEEMDKLVDKEPEPEENQPFGVAVKALASMLPFCAYACYCLLSKE